MDDACLRAWGYPHDQAIRQELLDALEWESSLRPEHARASIRELFDQVQNASAELANRIRENGDRPEVTQLIPAEVNELRESLTALMQVLETVRSGLRTA